MIIITLIIMKARWLQIKKNFSVGFERISIYNILYHKYKAVDICPWQTLLYRSAQLIYVATFLLPGIGIFAYSLRGYITVKGVKREKVCRKFYKVWLSLSQLQQRERHTDWNLECMGLASLLDNHGWQKNLKSRKPKLSPTVNTNVPLLKCMVQQTSRQRV